MFNVVVAVDSITYLHCEPKQKSIGSITPRLPSNVLVEKSIPTARFALLSRLGSSE